MTSTDSPSLSEPGDNVSVMISEYPLTILEPAATSEREPDVQSGAAGNRSIARGVEDEVNRFLLCALVSESARHIKERAKRDGEHLPMTILVRGVLRSYRVAPVEERGTLAGVHPDMAKLRKLNRKILKEEITRHVKGRVEDGKARLASANRLGDEAKIKNEREALNSAITAHDQFRIKFG